MTERSSSGSHSTFAQNQNILGPAPTEEDLKTLRRLPGALPWIAFLLCVVEFAERASYYGVTNIFANFIQWPLPERELALQNYNIEY